MNHVNGKLSFRSLRRFNIFMGILHFVQGILMILMATVFFSDTVGAFRLDVRQNFLFFNIDTFTLDLDYNVLFGLPIALLAAAFLLLSALAHGIISIPEKTNAIYNADLAKGINRFRWFEYAISSSLMIILIAGLFGIYDIGSLILIFFINAGMNLFGLVMEQLNSGRSKDELDWGPFWWGTIMGLIPWVVIILYVTGTASEALGEIPWFVWAIVGTYFVAFNTFPINMVLQYLKVGKWKNYIYGERVYIVLSLVAKTILAWLVFLGTFQPN